MKNKFAIIVGEPDSINVELIYKTWNKIDNNLKKNIFFIGNYNLINLQLKKIGVKTKTSKITNINNLKIIKNCLNIINIHLDFKHPFKIKDSHKSKYVLDCLDTADQLAKSSRICGFINCAIDKKIFNNKMGVTEYLGNKNKISTIMMIYNDKISVVPLTTHIDIKEVPKKLSKKLIEKKIIILNFEYFKIFKKKPKILILGLNPHNAEFRKNSEEVKYIIPAINYLKKRKINIAGPFPADTAFFNSENKKNSVIVGMYHDQVLAPFKAIYGFNAVNVTLGLSYLRASPDHGTAKNIVGLNKANPESLIKAILFFKKNLI